MALPHWRTACVTYFVTWRLLKKLPDLSSAERNLVASAVRHFDGLRYELHGYVIMNDHVHVVITPRGSELESIVQSWKWFTAKELNCGRTKSGAVSDLANSWTAT